MTIRRKIQTNQSMTIGQQIKWDFFTNGELVVNDKNGNTIYLENSNGYWSKREWDSEGNEIYWENSDGAILDNRPKHCENKIVEIEGIKYKLTKV